MYVSPATRSAGQLRALVRWIVLETDRFAQVLRRRLFPLRPTQAFSAFLETLVSHILFFFRISIFSLFFSFFSPFNYGFLNAFLLFLTCVPVSFFLIVTTRLFFQIFPNSGSGVASIYVLGILSLTQNYSSSSLFVGCQINILFLPQKATHRLYL